MQSPTGLKQAVLWTPMEGGRVRCNLCNHRCSISEGSVGRCSVRRNINGVLYSLVYDKICAANTDPIEKKPLFHFQPGSRSFSIATPGCNFRCAFCQNWQISQADLLGGKIPASDYTPEDIVDAALRSGCKSIAYTYTEPTVFIELAANCARFATKKDLANVFVSNGYMTSETVDFVRDWLDGINIDLKSFSEDFYKNLCKAKLQPVLDTISYIASKTDIWMEITTLVVPGQNDSEDELKQIAEFIASLSLDIPWHISRFYPQYKMDNTPPTPAGTLQRAYDIGKEAGLRYVYLGNMPGARAESTFCYSCGALLIERSGYQILSNNITDYRCGRCGAEIAGFGLS